MLEQFVDRIEKYRGYAYSICHCHTRKDDLVNEMFLKLHGILDNDPSMEVTDGYIYRIMRSIFLNGIRDNREFATDHFHVVEENDGILEARMMVSEELGKMRFVERETLYATAETSLRKLEQKSGINYLQLHKKKHEYLEKLKKQINGKAIDFKI